jgi:hypothetical protein
MKKKFEMVGGHRVVEKKKSTLIISCLVLYLLQMNGRGTVALEKSLGKSWYLFCSG